MQDRFYGKTWIFWVQLIVFGGFAAFSMAMFAVFCAGALPPASGEISPGPPLLIFGIVFSVIAALAAFNIVARFTPIIRCYREGIECKLIGATSLDSVPLVPGLIRVAWTILSCQGFSSQRLRIAWEDFVCARVGGMRMAYVLTLVGLAINTRTMHARDSLAFHQVALSDDPQWVAQTLNRLAVNPGQREHLPSWQAAAPTAGPGSAEQSRHDWLAGEE